ncbi:acyl-CoA synthetase (NDP forming) [Palleronia aestuarii]|uniref:Acyl-CoA synthetase (NDP forming) n=1 Tax=Palleronia aestuarii TaxID=568105 RepID=A0A2W7N5W2_9RHOB|nr:acetate--CoA ligase family protein [Palleronia aestuarii]PZX15103.1 acyl-CoA synthetase (NDP forming) [Palleronia aestuarii]
MSALDLGRPDLADALLRPRSVAIVGASANLSKNNSRPQRFLRKHGYEGAVYPVNPGYDEIFDVACHPTISDVGTAVDHAYLMVPTSAMEASVHDCVAAGVSCASIFSGGFAEAGPDGEALQRRIVDIAREGGLRLLGPNSLGVINPNEKVALSANAVLERDDLAPGRLGLVSQSGSLIGALISRGRARGIGFGTLVSVGNECDLSVGEIATMMLGDPQLDTISLFLETLRDRDALEEMAWKAKEVGKPVIAYVLGKSDLGRSLAQSHTGALAGDGMAMDSFLSDMGIVRVNLFETLIEAPALLAGTPKARGRRVAVVTTTGGGGALVADNLGARGIEVAPPSDGLRAALSGYGLETGDSPIVDLTMGGTREEVVDACLGALVADEAIDLVVMVVGSSSEFYPHLAVKPLAKWADTGKPVAAFLCPNAVESLELLQKAGIAAFRTPESCVDAIDAYLSWRDPRALPRETLPPAVTDGLSGRGTLDERRSLEVFRALGIVTADSRVLPAGAPIPDDLSYPIVAKILSDKIAHKSDIGGVEVGIAGRDELSAARERMLSAVAAHRPDVTPEGILVQSLHQGLGEAIVGFHVDPIAGPVVLVGLGGVLAETYRDVAVRLAPVTLDTAREMVAEVRGFALLRGARGAPKGDLDALAQTVVCMSGFATVDGPAVAGAEINPVLVGPEGQGVVAVDGLIHLLEADADHA